MTRRDLTDFRVLITGGAARIGKVVATYLADCGADVAVHYRTSESAARQLQTNLRERGCNCEIFKADLREFDELSELIDAADRELGSINGLVNNAAIWRKTPFAEAKLADWNDLFDVNLRAPYFLAQQFAASASRRNNASVINLVDVFGKRPLVEYSAYGMTKSALWYMTEVLAAELAPEVRVNGIAPGTVLLNEDHDAQIADELDERIPMGLTGGPEDVAETVAFLLGGPDYITGEVVVVDGARQHLAE